MSTTEALRTQLDNLQRTNQQLEIENARLREEHPEEAASIDASAERDQLRQEKERLVTESMHLKTLYDQLLRDSQEDQRAVEELQEVIAKKEACVEELSARCEDLWRETVEVKQTAELERYRALEKE